MKIINIDESKKINKYENNLNKFLFIINENYHLIINTIFFFKIIFLFLLLFIFIKYLNDLIFQFSKNVNLTKNDILEIMKYINITFNDSKIIDKIKIAIYSHSLSNGGVERNTALLINYLSKIKLFDLYIFIDEISNNEYEISKNVKRAVISYNSKKLKRYLLSNKINIFIYQFYDKPIITMLKSLKNIKTIFYNHSCFLFWIYTYDKYIFENVYNEYKNSKYIISIIPFENNYLLKEWGINTIYMNNFLTYDYSKVIPSDLSSKKILMIGRGSDKNKRFELGIKTMKYIIKEIPDSEMIVISDDNDIPYIKKLVNFLDLKNNIKFVGYTSTPEIYFKDASLHIFPTIAEAFPMVLSETKIYGIPNILMGIDYVSTSKGGVLIVYDDNPETAAKYAINILNNDKYRKKLGKEARKSMKKFNNENLFKKWVKLIILINKGEFYFQKLSEVDKKIFKKEALNILENQVYLLKKRIPKMENITLQNLLNFSFVKNINYK